jgi:hypothetical protein
LPVLAAAQFEIAVTSARQIVAGYDAYAFGRPRGARSAPPVRSVQMTGKLLASA